MVLEVFYSYQLTILTLVVLTCWNLVLLARRRDLGVTQVVPFLPLSVWAIETEMGLILSDVSPPSVEPLLYSSVTTVVGLATTLVWSAVLRFPARRLRLSAERESGISPVALVAISTTPLVDTICFIWWSYLVHAA